MKISGKPIIYIIVWHTCANIKGTNFCSAGYSFPKVMNRMLYIFVLWFLKRQLHGRAEIFKGMKMTFRTKILKKKYATLISIKNTTNFVLTTFLWDHFLFLATLLIAVNFTKCTASITLRDALRIIYQSCSPRSPPNAASSADIL